MTDKELIQALRKTAMVITADGIRFDDCKIAAADRLEALLAENEHFREVTKMVPQWVSVDERLPEERECVVAFDRDGVAATGYFDGVWHGIFDHNAVTHWVSLPEPPSTEGGGVNE